MEMTTATNIFHSSSFLFFCFVLFLCFALTHFFLSKGDDGITCKYLDYCHELGRFETGLKPFRLFGVDQWACCLAHIHDK